MPSPPSHSEARPSGAPEQEQDQSRPEPLPAWAQDAPQARTFDWLTEFAIPLCIIGLLSSFLYYLLEVRRALGAPVNALHWVGFWFVLAVVGWLRQRICSPFKVSEDATVIAAG